MRRITIQIAFLACLPLAAGYAIATDQVGQLGQRPAWASSPATDWLIDPSPFTAGVYRTDRAHEIVLDNGLVCRTFRLTPNGATVAFDSLMTGQSVLRGVKLEALVTIDGQRYEVGGLTGQPNYAYLLPEWLENMEASPDAMRLIGFDVGQPTERMHWKRPRHHAPDAVWPPKGAYLRMDYGMPIGAGGGLAPDQVRPTLWLDTFDRLSDTWSVHASRMHERTSFENEGKAGEIYALSSASCFAERELPEDVGLVEATIHPGTDQGVSWGPGMALVYEGRVVRVGLRLGDRGDHGHF